MAQTEKQGLHQDKMKVGNIIKKLFKNMHFEVFLKVSREVSPSTQQEGTESSSHSGNTK